MFTLSLTVKILYGGALCVFSVRVLLCIFLLLTPVSYGAYMKSSLIISSRVLCLEKVLCLNEDDAYFLPLLFFNIQLSSFPNLFALIGLLAKLYYIMSFYIIGLMSSSVQYQTDVIAPISHKSLYSSSVDEKTYLIYLFRRYDVQSCLTRCELCEVASSHRSIIIGYVQFFEDHSICK